MDLFFSFLMESIFPKKPGARSPEQRVCLCCMQHHGKALVQQSLGQLILIDNSPLCWPGDSFPVFVSILSVYINKPVCQAAAGGFGLPRAAHGKVAGLWTQTCPKRRGPKLPLTLSRGCTAFLAKAGAPDSLFKLLIMKLC